MYLNDIQELNLLILTMWIIFWDTATIVLNMENRLSVEYIFKDTLHTKILS